MASSSFAALAALAMSCLLILLPCSVSGWSHGGATWYVPPEGAGTDGGACGVPCNWHGLDIVFKVDACSNPNYLAVLIEYEAGDGDLSAVELQQRDIGWASMQELSGAVWKYSSRSTLQAPISIRLTSGSGKQLIASNVIPSGWQAGRTYRSIVNYY
uniref:Uncharacterized protein n=1 Tax=Aegilops tauschii TaxID=37682 RepID=R7W5X8_AEGTA